MASTALTRVLLVDDHEIMRDGLREVLERSGAFEIVGEAGDGETAVRVAQSVKPDVVIMDVMMPLVAVHSPVPQLTTASNRLHPAGHLLNSLAHTLTQSVSVVCKGRSNNGPARRSRALRSGA